MGDTIASVMIKYKIEYHHMRDITKFSFMQAWVEVNKSWKLFLIFNRWSIEINPASSENTCKVYPKNLPSKYMRNLYIMIAVHDGNIPLEPI